MARDKRIFISDVHLGMKVGQLPGGKYDYTWLKDNAANDLTLFLQYLNIATDVSEVILLGDIFDDWLCPVDRQPPTMRELIASHQNEPIITALQTLARNPNLRVIFLPGNHDMSMTAEILAAFFPGMILGGLAKNDCAYRSSRLLAEHGSAHALFNAPDYANARTTGLPLGYFLTRVVTTRAYNTGHDKESPMTIIKGLIDAAGHDKFAEASLDAVLDEAGLSLATSIKMPSGGPESEITAQTVRARYGSVYQQWIAARGTIVAVNGILAEVKELGFIADSLCTKGDTNVVIFGHSHEAKIERRISPAGYYFVYANCGAWCDKDHPRTYVETEKNRDNRTQTIRLVEWQNGRVGKITEQTIEL
jgi:UDP-2,3-diacylglucosamine pyrophosphatase LpxH